MRGAPRFVLWLVTALLLGACGPVVETRYSYKPPDGAGGLGCVQQCEQTRGLCVSTSRITLQACRSDARRQAEIEYAYYLRSLPRGKKPSRSLSWYDNSASCSSDEGRCKLAYNECYGACGGQVTTRRICTSGCDQLDPPVLPYGQVGPTLLNGSPVQTNPPPKRSSDAAPPARAAEAAPAAAVRLARQYRVSGADVDGSTYQGTVTVRPDGARYKVRWDIDGEIYEGIGRLTGNRFVIDGSSEGEAFHCDFRVAEDGRIAGPWTSGADDSGGSEEWTPS